MAEGRTDPQVALAGALLQTDALELGESRTEWLLRLLAREGFEVVPADDRLTAEEANYLYWRYKDDDPHAAGLWVKMRRLAGRED